MADSKNTSTDEVKEVKVAPEAPFSSEKVVGDGENLYFFPDIQKSVVAKTQEEAQIQVQSELDAFKKEQDKDNK